MQLSCKNLQKSFRQRQVVKNVSFHVKGGEVVGLLGPNGAGKTTSFYIVVGLLFADAGSVILDNEDISTLPMHIRARRGISYLPQNTSIFRKLSVRDNLLSVMEICKIPREEHEGLLLELFDKFQIGHIGASLGASLSGGERRRVEIARSLIIKPKFLLLDEPFAGIDPVTVNEIQEIIKNLSKDGLGVLITDHNVRETLSACTRSYVLARGSIIADGSPDEVLNNPEVREIYLGEHFRL